MARTTRNRPKAARRKPRRLSHHGQRSRRFSTPRKARSPSVPSITHHSVTPLWPVTNTTCSPRSCATAAKHSINYWIVSSAPSVRPSKIGSSSMKSTTPDPRHPCAKVAMVPTVRLTIPHCPRQDVRCDGCGGNPGYRAGKSAERKDLI